MKKAGKKGTKKGAAKKTTKPQDPALGVVCPTCNADPFAPCLNEKGKKVRVHLTRIQKAQTATVTSEPAAKPDTRIISRAHNRPRVEVKLSDEERAFIVRAIEAGPIEDRKPLGPWMLAAALRAASENLGGELAPSVDKGAAAQ